MACRFSNVVDDCWELCSLFLFRSFLSLCHPGNVGLFLCYNQRLYKWEKWFYYINICINKTLYVVNRDTLCAALSCSLCLFLFLSSNVIKNNCQPEFVCKCWTSCLVKKVRFHWRFCKAARRGQSCSSQGEQSFTCHCCFFQPMGARGVSSNSSDTFWPPRSTGGRSHLDDMQITFQWGRDLIQSYSPAGRQMAAQCDVWKDAWRCWQRAAGPLPASITPPLSIFPSLLSV